MIVIKVSVNFAGVLASGTFLIIGAVVLVSSGSMDFDTVVYACRMSITGAMVAGFLGYIIGIIFESAKIQKHAHSKKSRKHSDLLIDDLLVNDLNKVDEINEVTEEAGV